MTNLLATIFFTITTNWTTVSTTYPSHAGLPANHLVYLAPQAAQVGRVFSNTYAKIEWRGGTVDALLESVEIGRTNRTVDANHLGMGLIR
jgi:hypothetical protein